MPRIDPLLTAMLSNRGEAVSLGDGEIAHIIKGGSQHPLTRQPLAEGQLLTLLKEMAAPDIGAKLGGQEPVEFIYVNTEGHFIAKVRRESGSLKATVSAWKAPEPVAARVEVASALATAAAVPAAPPHSFVSPVAPSVPPTNGHSSNGHQQNGHASNGQASSVSMERAESHVAPVAPPLAGRTIDGSAREDIERLLTRLVNESGSDLHLRVGEPPILRVHGELKRLEDRAVLGPQIVEAMVVSIMPDRNFDEYMKTNDTDFAHQIEGVARFRANAFRDHHGAGAVFRVIPDKVATVEDLGITPEVQNLCQLTKGLVLVTGPTGSGKSTTLGALVDLVNRTRDDHVITIEDPIEFVHKNKRCVITQRQVGLHTGSFKGALRAALREDPDVVLIGELRDLETISIALETAETGHLVFGTLHTTTAIGTVDRVIDQFPADRQAQIRVMLADSLKGVISQTLCKKIGGGRVAAREILLSMPSVANLIREAKAFQIASVMQTSRKLGMIQLGDVLIDLVDQGQVEPQEAYMKATDKPAFVAMLKTRGHDIGFLNS